MIETVGVVRERERESNRLKKIKEKTWNKTRQRTYEKIGFLSCFCVQNLWIYCAYQKRWPFGEYAQSKNVKLIV